MTKKQTIELLTTVNGVGPAIAKAAYEELGIDSLDAFIKAASNKELQKIDGVGPTTEKRMLADAKSFSSTLKSTPKKAVKKAPAKKKTPAKKSTAKKTAKKPAKKAPVKKKPVKKAAAKKPTKKSAAKKPTPKKTAPKKAAKTPESQPKKKAEPKRVAGTKSPGYQKPQRSSAKVSIPGLVFKLAKKIIKKIIS